MPAATKERRCVGGPMHGWPVRRGLVRGSQAWIDMQGRCHLVAAQGRSLYRIDGDEMRHVRHARQCGGCGVSIDPDPAIGSAPPACPLCGASA
jgi:hypothetical protein